MKKHKIFSLFAATLLVSLTFSSCMDDFDEPNTDDVTISSPTSVGEVNTTIAALKDKYCATSEGADFSRNASNFYTKINDDIVITGVIVANDISGNLYQTLMLRNIESDGTDQCILLSVKNTCLYPYFPLGQRIKINMKGLYAGCYSKTPKIGQPYYTSHGNLNLGPMLLDLCRTNIEFVGKPDLTAPELVPVDLTDADGEAWLRASANKTYDNCPLLATVSGAIEEMSASNRSIPQTGEVTNQVEPIFYEELADGTKEYYKLFAPDALHDDGYGVDRTILLKTNTSKVVLRTSTENDIAFSFMPADVRSYTGILSYYDGWQVQLRSLDDVYPKLREMTLVH